MTAIWPLTASCSHELPTSRPRVYLLILGSCVHSFSHGIKPSTWAQCRVLEMPYWFLLSRACGILWIRWNSRWAAWSWCSEQAGNRCSDRVDQTQGQYGRGTRWVITDQGSGQTSQRWGGVLPRVFDNFLVLFCLIFQRLTFVSLELTSFPLPSEVHGSHILWKRVKTQLWLIIAHIETHDNPFFVAYSFWCHIFLSDLSVTFNQYWPLIFKDKRIVFIWWPSGVQ